MSATCQAADLFRAAPDWKGRGLALLRLLAFVAMAGAFFFGALRLLSWLAGSSTPVGPRSGGVDWPLAIVEAALALAALAATAAMAGIGGHRLRDFGLGGSHRRRNFLVGIATGLAAAALLLSAMSLASLVSFAPAASAGNTLVLDGVFYTLLMLGVAFSEEMLCRGYALVALSQGLSFWPAALASSALFGLMHGFNPGETDFGLVSAALVGIVLAYSFRYTRSLWFAFGFHASWDYAQSFVFGVPNSGVTLPGSLLHAQSDGPPWLTGGSAGPEGSVLILAVLAAVPLVVRRFLKPAEHPA